MALLTIFVLAAIAGLPAYNGEAADTVLLLNLGVGGDANHMRGYLEAQIKFSSTGQQMTGPVCGQVDYYTAWFSCVRQGWLFATGTGTVGSFALTPPTAVPIIGNLTCRSPTTSAGNEPCTFSRSNATIDPCTDKSKIAAISCYWSAGQVAGLVVGLFAACILFILIPTIICCCCCCGLCSAATYSKL